ncbi:MAG: hypothetical protein HY514_02190 [Candidatus Aenigmarchaeota archaeon]|nr:hypothetical protein [Candidatus Aenigmarchaeota archaeon]
MPNENEEKELQQAEMLNRLLEEYNLPFLAKRQEYLQAGFCFHLLMMGR